MLERADSQVIARNTLSIQKDVLFAVFLREMHIRFSGYTLGNVWLILEPLLMMVVFIVLFGVRGRGEFGYVEPPIFIFAAFLPFRILWNYTMKRNMTGIRGVQGLLGFRQVRLFDIFLARTLSEAGVFLVVGLILGTIFLWFGFDPIPRDILMTLFYCMIMWIFAFGFGVLACFIGQITREVEKAINMISMPLMFISAVFFPMSVVPDPYRTWLAWNPLVHAMELIREAWLPVYISPVADLSYLAWWTVITLALALATYRLRWRRILAR